MSKNCVFISAGDSERFATYSLEVLSPKYDVLINHYGSDQQKRGSFSSARLLTARRATKFISMKSVYDEFIRDKYDWVAVFDDDAKFTRGSMDELVEAGERHGLDIVSPIHDESGRISYRIHMKTDGDHDVRFVNFVEMNFPVFKNSALAKYMDAYDGKLCGWGNDWWYCNVLDTESRSNAAVVDRVVVENPNSNDQMDNYMPVQMRMEEWIETKFRLGLREWIPTTVGFAWRS